MNLSRRYYRRHHAIQEKCILERAIPVDIESALEADPLQARGGQQHARRECCQLIVVASVQRQLDDFSFIDHSTAVR
jgi:hypothetical protein